MTHTGELSRRQILKAASAAAAASTVPHMVGASRAQELEPAELRFFFGANPQEAEARQIIIDAFMEKYPQISITTEISAGDPIQELQIQYAGGASPDIMMTWHSYAGLGARGVFADLNEFIENDQEFAETVANEHRPDLLTMFQMDGKQFALPEQYTGVVIYYNKSLFEEAGVEPPPADWTNTSWTFDAFLETATALTKHDGDRVNQFGFVDAWWSPLTAFVLGTSNGGNWFDQYVMPTECTVTDPRIIEGVQWYADLANVHHVMPNAEEIAVQAGPDMFMGGRAGMALTGHWMYPAFSGVDGLDFDIGVLPVGPGGTTAKTNLDSTGLGVSSQTEYPEQAWEFVKFSTGLEGQRLIAESGLFVPVLDSVMNSDVYTEAHSQVEHEQVFLDAMNNAIHQPVSPHWTEIAAVWARETDRVVRGEAQADEVMPGLEAEINEILSG